MKMLAPRSLAIGILLAASLSAFAQNGELSFIVISQATKVSFNEGALRSTLDAVDSEHTAFVVVNGIKGTTEPCSDNLYKRRRAILREAKSAVIVSPTARDWATCKNSSGKSTATAKLNILRDLLFSDGFTLGENKIPVVRQSTIARFRGFPENARWEIGEMMFATINLPANNNNYISDAGRNSEFEDRLVANRDWLRRVFLHAALRKHEGIILFCDANPLQEIGRNVAPRDGFTEIRKEILNAASKYSGKVLLIHSASVAASPEIHWRRNVGEMAVGATTIRLTVNPATPHQFSIGRVPPATTDERP